ncbi:MAG: hypothetical protein HY927_05890 [Elusimicrobia bacterium]|nr:hypothetical protein [Elusimicrobiota bacterium]
MRQRTYLVDGSNAVRRRGYDPRFPLVEDRRTRGWLGKIDALAGEAGERLAVEVFFDGPPRDVGGVYESLAVRFSPDRDADDMIMGVVRLLASTGRGAVVVTEDGGLAADAREEGARVIGFAEFETRLREGRA